MRPVEQKEENEIGVTTSSGVSRHRTKIVRVKLAGPKEIFLLSDALARYGSFPTVEQFLGERAREALAEYLRRAEDVVSRASDLSKTHTPNR